MSQPLNLFVHQALSQGLSREQIAQALEKGGWSPEEIRTALHAYVDTDLTLPVPRKSASTSPKEAFLFLVLFSSLFTWMFAIGATTFDLLNLWLPMPGEGERLTYLISSLRSGIASMLVAFPLFLFMDHLATAEARRNPGQRISPIRRWLTYLTLFAAATALVSDLITLTLTFLEGEITLRFFLKVSMVAMLAGSAFAHYLLQLRKDETEPSQTGTSRGKGRLLLAGAVGIVLAIAIWNAGSPLKAKLYRQDKQRIQDLVAIKDRIEAFNQRQGHLPARLEDLNREPDSFVEHATDGVTRQPYHYRVVDPTHVEIGATFALPSSRTRGEQGFWNHEAGPATFCIEVKATPNI